MEFKERIRTLRTEKGLSVAQLASRLGKTDTAIRMWETGRSKPDADTLLILADLFSCSVDYLLGLSATKNDAEKEEIKKILNHDGIQSIVAAIKRLIDGLDENKADNLIDSLRTMFALLGMYSDNIASANKSRSYILGDADKMGTMLSVLNQIRNCDMGLNELRNMAIYQPQIDAAVSYLREFVFMYTLYAFNFDQLKGEDGHATENKP